MPILVLDLVQLYCLSYVFLSYNIIAREGTSFLPSFFPIMLFLEDGKYSKKFLMLKALRVLVRGSNPTAVLPEVRLRPSTAMCQPTIRGNPRPSEAIRDHISDGLGWETVLKNVLKNQYRYYSEGQLDSA